MIALAREGEDGWERRGHRSERSRHFVTSVCKFQVGLANHLGIDQVKSATECANLSPFHGEPCDVGVVNPAGVESAL